MSRLGIEQLTVLGLKPLEFVGLSLRERLERTVKAARALLNPLS